MDYKEPHDCPIYNFCSQNICPLDPEIESIVGRSSEKCLNFARIKELLSEEQLKRYMEVVNKLK